MLRASTIRQRRLTANDIANIIQVLPSEESGSDVESDNDDVEGGDAELQLNAYNSDSHEDDSD